MKNIITSLLSISLVFAVSDKINFRHITVDKDGLSESFVYNIFQDSKGFIWITTDNGLDKYDGYSIKQYQHLNDDTTSIAQGQGKAIYEDNKGNILVGTADLIRINTETDERTYFYAKDSAYTENFRNKPLN